MESTATMALHRLLAATTQATAGTSKPNRHPIGIHRLVKPRPSWFGGQRCIRTSVMPGPHEAKATQFARSIYESE